MMRAATARIRWKTLAISAVLAIVIGLELRHHRGDGAGVRDNSPLARLIAGLTRMADPTSRESRDKKALADEFRRLLEECLASPDSSRK